MISSHSRPFGQRRRRPYAGGRRRGRGRWLKLLPTAQVENRDVLEFTNKLFRRVYGKAYLDLVNRAPHLVGFIYDHMDSESPSGHRLSESAVAGRRQAQPEALRRLAAGGNCDLVINTHFLPAERIARLRTERASSVPQVTVCTDFDTHRLWVNQPCDRYFAATDEGAIISFIGGCRRRTLSHWHPGRSDL